MPATFFAVAGFFEVVLRGAGVMPALSLAMPRSVCAGAWRSKPYAGHKKPPEGGGGALWDYCTSPSATECVALGVFT